MLNDMQKWTFSHVYFTWISKNSTFQHIFLGTCLVLLQRLFQKHCSIFFLIFYRPMSLSFWRWPFWIENHHHCHRNIDFATYRNKIIPKGTAYQYTVYPLPKQDKILYLAIKHPLINIWKLKAAMEKKMFAYNVCAIIPFLSCSYWSSVEPTHIEAIECHKSNFYGLKYFEIVHT